MQEATSLRQMFQSMVPDPVAVIQAVVISTNPLMVQAVNDDKLVLGSGLLCVPAHLSDYTVTVDISGGGGSAIKGAVMTVRQSLRAGDRLYLLSFNHGKKYYILDRKGA